MTQFTNTSPEHELPQVAVLERPKQKMGPYGALTAVNLQYFGKTDPFQNNLLHSIWGWSWQSRGDRFSLKHRPLITLSIINMDYNISLTMLRCSSSVYLLGERNSKKMNIITAVPFASNLNHKLIPVCLRTWRLLVCTPQSCHCSIV